MPSVTSPPENFEIDVAVEQRACQRQRGVDPLALPTAMAGIEPELVLDVAAGERLMRAAAQMRLALLDRGPVAQSRADMAGIVRRIGILGIDHVFHLGGER